MEEQSDELKNMRRAIEKIQKQITLIQNVELGKSNQMQEQVVRFQNLKIMRMRQEIDKIQDQVAKILNGFVSRYSLHKEELSKVNEKKKSLEKVITNEMLEDNEEISSKDVSTIEI